MKTFCSKDDILVLAAETACGKPNLRPDNSCVASLEMLATIKIVGQGQVDVLTTLRELRKICSLLSECKYHTQLISAPYHTPLPIAIFLRSLRSAVQVGLLKEWKFICGPSYSC